jgi:hypothetical protein
MAVVIRKYTPIAEKREEILEDARNLLTQYDFETVKEELESLPRAYGVYGAEMIYRGEAPDAKLIMLRTIKNMGQTAEAFIEGDRGLVKRT